MYDAQRKVEETKAQIAIQQGYLTSKVTVALQDPANEKKTDELYRNYLDVKSRVGEKALKDNNIITRSIINKADYLQYLTDNSTLLGSANKSFGGSLMNNIAAAFRNVYDGGTNWNDPKLNANRAQQMKDDLFKGNNMDSYINTAEKQFNHTGAGDVSGYDYKVYTDVAGKDSYLTPVNTALTSAVLSNPKGYTYVGKDGAFHDFEDLYNGLSKDQQANIKVSFSNNNMSAGGVQRWANHLEVYDKDDKQGKSLASFPIVQKNSQDGGLPERMNIIQNLLPKLDPSTREYKEFKVQLAQARFANIMPTDIERATAGYNRFNQNTPIQDVLDPQHLVTDVGDMKVKIVRRNITGTDKEGRTETKPMYSAAVIRPDGTFISLIPNLIKPTNKQFKLSGSGKDAYDFNFDTQDDLILTLNKNYYGDK